MKCERLQTLQNKIKSGIYYEKLVNNPIPHHSRGIPELIFFAEKKGTIPIYTIVTPVFEHGFCIDHYLSAIANCASIPFDWILIDDASTDDSIKIITDFMRNNYIPLACDIMIIHNSAPIFETACDNILFSLSRSEIIIEIQADIFIKQVFFDRILIKASMNGINPSAVSGRCCHPLGWLASRTGEHENFPSVGFGLTGIRIDTPDVIKDQIGRLYCAETVNRGPWLVKSSDLERHGYLDEKNYFLDNSDHDFHLRLFRSQTRLPVYSPILIESPLAFGASRRQRSGLNEAIYNLNRREKIGSKLFLDFLENYIPYQASIEIPW